MAPSAPARSRRQRGRDIRHVLLALARFCHTEVGAGRRRRLLGDAQPQTSSMSGIAGTAGSRTSTRIRRATGSRRSRGDVHAVAKRPASSRARPEGVAGAYFASLRRTAAGKRVSECAAKASRQPSPGYPPGLAGAEEVDTLPRQIFRTVASIAGSPAASEYKCAWARVAQPSREVAATARAHGGSAPLRAHVEGELSKGSRSPQHLERVGPGRSGISSIPRSSVRHRPGVHTCSRRLYRRRRGRRCARAGLTAAASTTRTARACDRHRRSTDT